MIQVIVSSIISGSLYTVMAIGLVAIFKTTRVFNFAQGQIAAISAYMGYSASNDWHMPFVVCVVIGGCVGAVIGVLADRLILIHLYQRSQLELVVATFGISLILTSIITGVWGEATLSITPPFNGRNVTIFGTAVSEYGICVVAFGVLVVVLLSLVLSRTQLGLRLRATFDDPSAARLTGVRVERMRTLSWAIGGSLAGLAGVLLVPFVFLTPDTMNELLIISFAAAVIGGFSSFYGAIVGGLSVALGTSFLTRYISLQYGDALFYGAVIVFLWLVPHGIFGEREDESVISQEGEREELLKWVTRTIRRVAPKRLAAVRHRATRRYPLQIPLLAVVVILIFAAPTILGNGWELNLQSWLINLIAVAGLAVTTFYAGRICLAQGAYMAIGAYATAMMLKNHAGLWPLVLIASFILVGIVGLLFEIGSQRLSGAYYAVASLAVALVVPLIAAQWINVTGGTSGLPVPSATWGSITLDESQLYWVFAVIAVIVLVALVVARNSPAGRRLVATRDSHDGALSLGIRVTPRRVAAAALGAGLGGLAGSMAALQTNVVSPTTFDFAFALTLFVAAVVAGSIVGSAWGAAVITLVPVWLENEPLYSLAVFGAVLVLSLFLLPRGRDLCDVIRRSYRKDATSGMGGTDVGETVLQKGGHADLGRI